MKVRGFKSEDGTTTILIEPNPDLGVVPIMVRGVTQARVEDVVKPEVERVVAIRNAIRLAKAQPPTP